MAVRSYAFTTVALVLLIGACGGGSDNKAPAGATSVPTVTAGPTTPTTFGGVVGASATQACLADARAVQDASDAYIATHGGPAPSMSALVADGHLRAAPSSDHGYTIGYDPATGMVTASGACSFG